MAKCPVCRTSYKKWYGIWRVCRIGAGATAKVMIMINGERLKVRQKAVRWPCGVCSKGVGSSSIQCTTCQKWVHKQCSEIKGSMSKVMKSFICRGCFNPVTSASRTSVDIGASAKLQLADKFTTQLPRWHAECGWRC